MDDFNERLKVVFREFLPKNATENIQKELSKKGFCYTKTEINTQIKLTSDRRNKVIIHEAMRICNGILDNKIKKGALF